MSRPHFNLEESMSDETTHEYAERLRKSTGIDTERILSGPAGKLDELGSLEERREANAGRTYAPTHGYDLMGISNEPGPGYHLSHIDKGVLGDLSKIREELDEAYDAESQGVKIMVAVELSDMIGAIKAYAEKHLNMTLEDLLAMQRVTERAFRNGRRK